MIGDEIYTIEAKVLTVKEIRIKIIKIKSVKIELGKGVDKNVLCK